MIREAESADIPALVEMGEAFFAAAGLDKITTYDKLSTARTLSNLIISPDGVVLVWDREGEPVGMVGALLYPFYFNVRHRHGNELFLWCNADAPARAGVSLIRALERWALDNGAQSFAMTALSQLRPDAVRKLYERDGYHASDATYIKRLGNGDWNVRSDPR